MEKNPPANAGDGRRHGFDLGLGRSPGGGNGNPLQYSCLENPRDRGAWRATVHRISQSQTRLSLLTLKQGGARANNRFLCMPTPQRKQSLFLIWGEGRVCVQGSSWGGWLRRFAHPSGGVECRGTLRTLLLLLTPSFCSWLFRSGSRGFLVSVSFVQNLPQPLACTWLF